MNTLVPLLANFRMTLMTGVPRWSMRDVLSRLDAASDQARPKMFRQYSIIT
jgi:hypothetical protein